MMHELNNFSLPLFRAFGIQVRIHILYIIVTLGMMFRTFQFAVTTQDWIESIFIWVVLLFVIVLLHEFGHCFAARSVDGSADTILMWPLGGLAFCDAPRTLKAQFVTTAGGPFVNLIICLVVAVPMLLSSYLPPLNIFKAAQLSNPDLYHLGDGKYHVAQQQKRFVLPGTDQTVQGPILEIDGNKLVLIDPITKKSTTVEVANLGVYPSWILWLGRIFWLSWFLFWFNMIPAFPLDGGRLFQYLVWWRSDYRTGTIWACYSGYICAGIFLIASIGTMDPMMGFLGLFIAFTCYSQLFQIRMGDQYAEGEYSAGYGGYADEPETPTRVKKQNFIQRWRHSRRIRRIQREEAERMAEQKRLDDLLDKVHQHGLGSLSDEEKRFMTRVSARYKNNR